MSIAHLPTPPQDPSCPAGRVRALHSLIDDLHTLTIGPTDAALLSEVDRARTRLDGLRLKLIAAAQDGDVAAGDGLATTADWVARRTRSTRQDSARDAALAGSLAGSGDQAPLTGTRSALEDGALSAAHASVIAGALQKLPAGVTADQRCACESRLVELARRYDPSQLRRVARRILSEVEPDETVVDAHENDLLVAEEDAAYARARLSFHDNQDGTTTGHFTLPNLQADVLRKVIDAMTAPRRAVHSSRVSGRDTRVTRATESPAAVGQTNPLARDQVDPAHARGLALAQLLEHLPVDHLHGPATTQVAVLMDVEILRGHLKAAGLDTDRPLSADEARRLVCNSGVFGTVLGRGLGGRSVVLDVGRKSRLFTEAQRAAVDAVHTHCATRGCGRPVAWCELHHRVPWSRGGRTDLENAVPLCGWHHRRVHDHRYLAEWNADGSLVLVLRT